MHIRLSLLMLLVLAAPQVRAGDQFRLEKWFQISFCQDIKSLNFLTPGSPTASLPAWGLAADWSKPERVIHFYQWNLLNGQTLDHTTIPIAAGFDKVSLRGGTVAKDGRRVLIPNSTHEVILFDTQSKTVLKRFSGHRSETSFAYFSTSERRIVAVDGSFQIWVWDTDGDEESPVQVINAPTWATRLTLDDATGELTAYTATDVLVYDVDSAALKRRQQLAKAVAIDRMHRPESLIFTPDGAAFAANTSTNASGSLSLIKSGGKDLVWTHDFGMIKSPFPGFPDTSNDPSGFAFSPSGKCLVIGNFRKLTTVDPRDGTTMFEQSVNSAGYYLQFTPDGRYLIDSGSCDVTIYEAPASCL